MASCFDSSTSCRCRATIMSMTSSRLAACSGERGSSASTQWRSSAVVRGCGLSSGSCSRLGTAMAMRVQESHQGPCRTPIAEFSGPIAPEIVESLHTTVFHYSLPRAARAVLGASSAVLGAGARCSVRVLGAGARAGARGCSVLGARCWVLGAGLEPRRFRRDYAPPYDRSGRSGGRVGSPTPHDVLLLRSMPLWITQASARSRLFGCLGL